MTNSNLRTENHFDYVKITLASPDRVMEWGQRTLPNGQVVGAELDRMGLLADMVAFLPTSELPEERRRLLDARGEVVYQWGEYEPAESSRTTAKLALPAPLAGWALTSHLSGAAFEGRMDRSTTLSLWVGLAGLALAARSQRTENVPTGVLVPCRG